MPNSAEKFGPVTLGDLIDAKRGLAVHCIQCGRCKVIVPDSLPFLKSKAVPDMRGAFKCSRCGSTQTEARPDYSDFAPALTGYSLPVAP